MDPAQTAIFIATTSIYGSAEGAGPDLEMRMVLLGMILLPIAIAVLFWLFEKR